ncbi:MAG TPA: metal ABC transporter permease [Solirubrobacteraceae bacterium]|nr:metal ABC transporter permease [Solirubrobacteraceae bacterium]
MTLLATVWSAIGEPWDEPLMRRAFAEVVLLGVAGGAIGTWVVLFGLSYGAESLSHALLPGLVLAALAGVPLLLGGAVGLIAAAVSVALAGRTPEVGRDTAIGVVVTAMLGLGALLALSPRTPAGLDRLLFGDVLGVGTGDLVLAGALCVVLLAALAVLHPSLLVVGFDRLNARALGRRPALVELALLVLLALTLLVAVRGLGNLLVVALLVAPAAAARLVTHRLPAAIGVAMAVAAAGGVGGLYASYYLDTAAGASIVTALVLAYLVAALVARRPAA